MAQGELNSVKVKRMQVLRSFRLLSSQAVAIVRLNCSSTRKAKAVSVQEFICLLQEMSLV